MSTPTTSTSHVYHTPLNEAEQTAQALENRISQIDAALLVRQNNISYETSRAQGAETALMAALSAAVAGEMNARIAGDADEIARRNRDVTDLQTQLRALYATSGLLGGTPTTTLAHNAGAAQIASIAGNGTTTTVTTTAAHGFVTGDFVATSQTANYNGDSPAITVLSATQFTYPSAVNAATEFSGIVATKRLFVANGSAFAVGQAITITSNAGFLHGPTISAIAGNVLTLSAAVPATWTGSDGRASSGNEVAGTIPELVRLRYAVNAASPPPAPDALRLSERDLYHVEAYREAGGTDRSALTAAITAAITAGKGTVVLWAKDYTLDSYDGTGTDTRAILIDGATNINIVGVGPTATRLVYEAGTNNTPFIVRSSSQVDIGHLALKSNRGSSPTTGLSVQNSSHVRVHDFDIRDMSQYGISVAERSNVAKISAATTIGFAAAGSTISDSAHGLGIFAPGDKVAIIGPGAYYTNLTYSGVRTVLTVAGDGSSMTVSGTLVNQAAGGQVTIQAMVTAPCDDIEIYRGHIENCEYGLELFAKELSRNLSVHDMTFRDCGFGTPEDPDDAGMAMKFGQGWLNAEAYNIKIEHCAYGISIGNYETCHVHDIDILNCVNYSLAITLSYHQKYRASFASLKVHDVLIHTIHGMGDYADVTSDYALNIAGIHPVGAIFEVDVTINGTHRGIGMARAFAAYSALMKIHARVYGVDLGAFESHKITSVVSTTNGSPVLTVTSSTLSVNDAIKWSRGVLVSGAGITDGAYVELVDTLSNTVRISANATATATGVTIAAPQPVYTELSGEFHNTKGGVDGAALPWQINIAGQNVMLCDLVLGRFGEYAVQIEAARAILRRVRFCEPNAFNTANRACILINEAASVVDVDDCEVDNGNLSRGASYLIHNDVGATVRDKNTSFAQAGIPVYKTQPTTTQPGAVASGGIAEDWGTAAPTSGAFRQGHIRWNTQPTVVKNIQFWRCDAGGTPGTWSAHGTGFGPLANRPAGLTLQDAGFRYKQTDSPYTEHFWTGTTYI